MNLKEHIFLTGSSFNHKSIPESGLWAGGLSHLPGVISTSKKDGPITFLWDVSYLNSVSSIWRLQSVPDFENPLMSPATRRTVELGFPRSFFSKSSSLTNACGIRSAGRIFRVVAVGPSTVVTLPLYLYWPSLIQIQRLCQSHGILLRLNFPCMCCHLSVLPPPQQELMPNFLSRHFPGWVLWISFFRLVWRFCRNKTGSGLRRSSTRA